MRNDCPDCNLPLRLIHVIDRGNNERGPKTHVGLAYQFTGEKQTPLPGLMFDGWIQAMMCEECKRVLFSAVPVD